MYVKLGNHYVNLEKVLYLKKELGGVRVKYENGTELFIQVYLLEELKEIAKGVE